MGTETILRRLERLREEIVRLRWFAAMSDAEFFSHFEHIYAAERCLQVAIQCCLDIANHLVGLLGLPAGEDYGGLFVTLAGAGVLPGDFADELRRMAGFRNILVHGYLQTDPRLVRGLLVQRVDDLVCFGDLAMRALERVP